MLSSKGGYMRRHTVLLLMICLVSAAGSAAAAPRSVSRGDSPNLPAVSAAVDDPFAELAGIVDPADLALGDGNAFLLLEPWRGRAGRTTTRLEVAGSVPGPGWAIERPDPVDRRFRLSGPPVALPEPDAADAVRRLASRLPGLFGAAAGPASLEVVFDRAKGPSGVVRLRQVQDGARIEGASIQARFDPTGRLVDLRSSVYPEIRTVNSRSLAEGDALRIAEEAVRSSVPSSSIMGRPRVEAWLVPASGGLVHVWQVRTATRDPFGSWMTEVDASDGKVRFHENRIESSVRNGVGNVFRRNSDYPGRVTRATLTNLFAGADNPDSKLKGRNFEILDNNFDDATATNFAFLFSPFSSQGDYFDQTNAYFHMETARARFASQMRVPLSTPFFTGSSLPTVTNVGGMCNAFYSPDLIGTGPGFAFGDEQSCPFSNDDFARDSDVVYHEFTHGVTDWIGVDLGNAPLNSYQRAINEAVADYHAANFTRDPSIGEVIGIGRTLDEDRRYPGDVGCDGGDPEEHCTGEIWGSILWDIQSFLGARGEFLEFNSLDFVADNGTSSHRSGIIDFVDAGLAFIQADQSLNAGRAGGIIYGVAVSHGVFGPFTFPGDNAAFFPINLSPPQTVRIGGVQRSTQSEVPFFFTAPPGATVTVTAVSRNAGYVPEFLYGAGDFTNGFFLLAESARSPFNPRAQTVRSQTVDAVLHVVDMIGNGAPKGTYFIVITVR